MAIVKDSIIYVAGEVFSKLLPFLLLPYLARKLGVEEYGELANALAYVAILYVIISLGQQGVITRYFYRYGKRGIQRLLTVCYLYSTIVVIVLCFFSTYTEYGAIANLSIAAFVQGILSVQLSLKQCQRKALQYSLIQVVNGLITAFVVFIGFEFYDVGHLHYINSIIISGAISLFLLCLFDTKKLIKFFGCFRFDKFFTFNIYFFSFGLPLTFHLFANVIKSHFDKIIIYNQFSASDLGIYSAGYQLAAVYYLFILSVNRAVVPYMYSALKQKSLTYKSIIKYFHISLFLFFVPSLFVFFIPEVVFDFVFGADFGGAKIFTVIFLLGFGLSVPYLLLVNLLFYYGKNGAVAICTFSSTLVYLFLVFIFSKISIDIIPLSLFVSNIVSVTLLYYYAKKTELLRI